MHGALRSHFDSDDILTWDSPAPAPRHAGPEIISAVPLSEPFERSSYGSRPLNLPMMGFIFAVHAVALTALILLDVVPLSPPRDEPIVVTLIASKAEPLPVEARPPATSEPREQPKLSAPVPVVKVETPTPPVVIAAAPPTVVQPLAPPQPSAPVTVGDLATKMIVLVPPRYPVESRRRKEQGTVYLSLLLATDGTVSEIGVARSSGFERLDKAALEAVRKWRWSPTIRGGAAVMVQGVVDIPFVLKM